MVLLANVGTDLKTKRAVRSTVRRWWDLRQHSCQISFPSFGFGIGFGFGIVACAVAPESGPPLFTQR